MSTQVVDAFQDQAFYDHPVGEIEVVQTHISWVVLAGDFVYKVKKPVDMGFLNFTTLPRRRYYCHQEVELNSRLSPDMYLGVVPVREHDGRLTLGADRGHIVEYAVKMRRLPQERMLDHLLAHGDVEPTAIDEVASILARFHDRAATGPQVDRYGSLRMIEGNWAENFEQTAGLAGSTIEQHQFDYLRAWVEATLRRNREVFRQRIAGGRIRDGHGDLRASAICLDDQLYIFDCIEFNRRFRYADVAADIAFLAMDLTAKGRPDLAERFVSRYVEESGDRGVYDVVDFYICYRAYVRGKVESFLAVDEGAPASQRREAAETARARFRQAVETANRKQPPVLLITCGLSGTGKSEVANHLAAERGMTVIASDIVRKELAGQPGSPHDPQAFGEGIYSPSFTRATYEELLRRAGDLLAGGTSVVLDATYSRQEWRDAASALAREQGALFLLLECRADAGMVRDRLTVRDAQGTSISDANWDVYLRQRETFEPVRGLTGWTHIVLDTSGTLQETLGMASELLSARLEPRT